MEWETFTIDLTSPDTSTGSEERERMDTTDQFEEALIKLIRSYQGKDGLTITLRNSIGNELV